MMINVCAFGTECIKLTLYVWSKCSMKLVCDLWARYDFLVFQMVLLLKEYLSSGDIAEATRCLQELEVPHFHHELVYEVSILIRFAIYVYI